jgi:DNA-binding transcriptional LysR family regulator
MLSWDDFRYVKAIADARSLAGAAEALAVNHSTVFRRLGQIEQELGSRLFERGRAGYALTACGEQMVELAERMGDEIVSFERKVTGHDLRPFGELRVTTSEMVLLHLLNGILISFRRAYPEIMLDVVVSNQRLNLSKRDADVAVRAIYQNPDPLAGRKIARIAWAVYGPHALAAEPFDPVIDGRQHDWLAFADHVSIARAMKWLKDRVGEKRIVYKANTMIGLAEAAAGGMGMALLPCYVGAAIPELAQLSPPLPELEGELWLITHPDLRNTARVRAFLDFCTGEIAQRRRVIECSDWKDQLAPRAATVVASGAAGSDDGGREVIPATFTRRVKSQ